MADPAFSPPPEAPNRDQDTQPVYSARIDAFMAWVIVFATELAALVTWVNEKITSIASSVEAASSSASTAAGYAEDAASSAAAAASVANQWVTGADWADGDTAWSPITRQTYRTNSALVDSTVDPSADQANWTILGVDPDEVATSARYFSISLGG